MKKELLLLRHGKSSWSEPFVEDYLRPLKTRGEKNALAIGRYLRENKLVPNQILSSPAVRAKQTVKYLCIEAGIPFESVNWKKSIYNSDHNGILGIIRKCDNTASRVLLVGHNPGLENLLFHLFREDVADTADGKLIPTATLVRVAVDSNWSRLDHGSSKLVEIIRPRSLHWPDDSV